MNRLFIISLAVSGARGMIPRKEAMLALFPRVFFQLLMLPWKSTTIWEVDKSLLK